jgi:hypothetical protein
VDPTRSEVSRLQERQAWHRSRTATACASQERAAVSAPSSLGHHGKECSFEAILKKYKLTDDPALVLLGRIVNGADTDNTLYHQAEGPGLQAVAEGFRHLGYKDDHALNAAEWIVYDALYAYAREMVKRGKPAGQFAN